MNESKILFVTCVNDEDLYATCIKHIEQLIVPEGYTIELLPIREATSMAQGYNSALENDAKYKIYLHQDTFILNQTFLQDMLSLFQSNASLGLLGLVGCMGLPITGNWIEGELVGKWITYKENQVLDYHYKEVLAPFERVHLIDGFLMVTQYDIPWKEDIFDGFHLYDASQSVEFAKRGYLVGIPRQITPWAAHYMHHEINREEWMKYQAVFRQHYGNVSFEK